MSGGTNPNPEFRWVFKDCLGLDLLKDTDILETNEN